MKKLALIVTLLVAAVNVGFSQNVSKNIQVGDFKSVNAQFVYDISITKGNSGIVQVNCPAKFEKDLDIYVSGGTLYLKMNNTKFKKMDDDNAIRVSIQMEEIKEISLSGAAQLMATGNFKTSNFSLTMSGASEIDESLNIDADNFKYNLSGASEASVSGNFKNISGHISGSSDFEIYGTATNITIGCSGASEAKFRGQVEQKTKVECSGASEVELEGSTNEIFIECSGASEVDAENMRSINATAQANGASSIKVYADKNLNLEASTGSKIRYYGNGTYNPGNNSRIARGN